MQVRGYFDFPHFYRGNWTHIHSSIPQVYTELGGNRQMYVYTCRFPQGGKANVRGPEAISLIILSEIEVSADLHRFPPSGLGLCFPSVLLWKLD